ncbi:MAG: bifunctional UDP-N-acetylglucosamine diphosphorylase/glucosamine-1-phosphate N-acetyltransferase GlmU [Deltaproteobacteria bacterium]|jgi:bifunctional UDP-N-acetylglucosamine pyrophosphorylase/glucosamine-1-phosphate N-acetyltransferase|nr:bifunctional UDP-N-acetylglucosamine diphosphorylase/glucosamine-1-phosphate N-acetyltransferase GlmU [Deltaproteobacteria bacterium]
MAQRIGALILAAGKGTRMHSDTPKVLQRLLNDPMLRYVVDALRPLFGDEVWAVVGYQAERVRKAFADGTVRFVEQREQLGTGHALTEALPALEAAGCERILVLNGDSPLVSSALLESFLLQAEGADLAFASLRLAEPAAYGRVVRKDGRVQSIVEAKDFDPAVHGSVTGEVNAGVYCLRLDLAKKLTPALSRANRSGEYYITDLVGLALTEGYEARGLDCGNDPSLFGINSPLELVQAEAFLREKILRGLLESGVIIHAPETVRVGPRVRIESGAELTGPCEIYGASRVAQGACIESHCVLLDSNVDADTVVRSFCHLEGARVGKNCTVGPFARLRPGAVMEESAHMGNFVELKQACLRKGAKANHLAYIGDADVGERANIGAGTITCNYDGERKHTTRIGAGAFIGSNTALVAPVNVGCGALVGAGSVITQDVPDGEMAIARGRQRNMPRRVIKS